MQITLPSDAANLIRMEYAEMPGLRVTFWQAQRLWNLSDHVCEAALRLLTSSGFLVQTRDGSYARPHPERVHAETSAVPAAARLTLSRNR